MPSLDDWIKTLPKKDQPFVAETISELWDLFGDLKGKGYLLPTLESEQRKDFPKILETSDGLFDVFNMLFSIPDVKGEFVYGKNKDFVEHNQDYGFTEKRYVNLLVSESLSVFLRNIELFRSCFLFVLKTKRGFSPRMGVGGLLIQLERICGDKGKKIKDKVNWMLRNGLAHGLFWLDGFTIRYATDISFREIKEIRLDDLWNEARKQSKVTQCLIKLVPAWYSGDC